MEFKVWDWMAEINVIHTVLQQKQITNRTHHRRRLQKKHLAHRKR